jgi:hypothetical protein
MAVLNTTWQDRTRVSPEDVAVTTPGDDAAGETPKASDAGTDAATPAAARAERPLAVYVTTPDSTAAFDKFDKVVLTDDKVAIGLKAFTTIKMSPEDAAKDPLFAGKGKEVPRFYFVSPDYKDVAVLEGSKLSVAGFYGAMKAEAKKHFKGDFDKAVRTMRDVLNEWDKISKERAVLEEKKAREENPTPADVKEMQKDFADLDTREKKANEQKDTLMKFELKAPAA